MCEFLSWIEKNGDILYLTYDDIYHTEKGKKLQKYCKCISDLVGHGAIRYYFKLEDGENKECTDFSTPDNFPAKLVDAIKRCEFAGLGAPRGLLKQQAYAEYKKIQQQAYAEYKKIQQQAYAEYGKIQQQAYAEYEKIQQQAYAEYEKIQQQAFWELFKSKKNRKLLWR